MGHTSAANARDIEQSLEQIARLGDQLRQLCDRANRELTELRAFHGNDDAAAALAVGMPIEIWNDVVAFGAGYIRDYLRFLDNETVTQKDRDQELRRWT